MSDAVQTHYDDVLGQRYTWMLGDLDARVVAERETLSGLGLPEGQGARAVDLGCGSGLHARALAEHGYAVRAVDRCTSLLGEIDDPRIETTEGDLLEADVGDAKLVCCMGDTLLHLPTADAALRVVDHWSPERALALSFRDLSGPALEGLGRFFVVRSDADRVHTCFLEDAGEHIRVHDLFHERDPDGGGFTLHKGDYLKLRLDPREVIARLEERGATVRHVVNRGMWTLLAR